MRQLRRARYDIADRINARLPRLLPLVHFHEAAVQLDFRILDADFLRVRFAAHRHQQLFRADVFLLAVAERDRDPAGVGQHLHVLHFRAGLDANLVFSKHALQFLRNLLVLNRHHARQHLENRHFRAEAIEDGGKLDAYRARPDNGERFRNLRHAEDLDIG